jgi:hypothetical protein
MQAPDPQRPVLDPRSPPPDIAYRFLVTDNVFETVRFAIRWGSIVAIAYLFGVPAIQALAGQTTVASFFIAIFTKEPPSLSVIWFWVAVWFMIWAVVERTLRHRKVKYLANRLAELEKQVDPERSSSGLAPTGQTHPSDDR